jgi:hypothetical protein
MRIELRRPLAPENAAPEIARFLARALTKDADLASAHAVNLTVEEPIEREALRAHIKEERFTKKLAWHLEELLRKTPAPRAIHAKYELGDSCALVIEPCSNRARAARLEWGEHSFEIDGRKTLLAIGRGSVRKRFPGARNDVVLDDALTFVSRDAFALRWDPVRAGWRLEVDELGRAFVEIVRKKSILIPQLGSILLEAQDVIALTGGPGSDERFEIRFNEEV